MIPFLSRGKINHINTSENNRDLWSENLKATEENFWIARRYVSRKQVLKLKTYHEKNLSN